MESFQKVFANIDLLAVIFKHLDFKDQLRLAQVNDQLTYAFEVLSGNVNYSALGIFQPIVPSNAIFVTGEMGVNRKYLQSADVLVDFLKLYADRVRDLTLWKDEAYLCEPILRNLRNLRSLSTYKIDRHTYETCYTSYPADLQELNIIDPFADPSFIVDEIGKYMKNLSKLQIVYTAAPADFNREKLIEICNLSKLEFLKIQIGGSTANLSLDGTINLKELHIRLKHVQHLQSLPLNNLKVLHLGMERVGVTLFRILTKSCANLEIFTLSHVKFVNLRTVSLPPKLTELSFHNCDGLTHACLKRILSEFQIIKFCSRETRYLGEFHDFQISSYIQSLEIDFVELTKFRSAYENNSQLKELIWRKSHLAGETYNVSFNRTPNLERLDMQYISAALHQLKSLQILKLNCIYSLIKWCDIEELIRHPTLQELSISNTFASFHPAELPEISLKTNITRIIITPVILRTWMKLWLQLFITNMETTLVCRPLTKSLQLCLAKELVDHKNFPRKLKTIDVSCLTIDCKDLRCNFEAVVLKFPGNDCIEQQKYCKTLKMASRGRIVLSWKYEYNF